MRVTTQPTTSKISVDPLASFLGMSFQDPDALLESKKNIEKRSYPRQALAEILESYNSEIGNDAIALQNTRRIGEDKSFCVVTGQQLGFMSGPIYTILKGLSCLLVAKQTGAVPIFWMATEDHDIPEVDHTYLIDSLGNLKRFHISLPREGVAVEDIYLTEKNIEEIQAFWSYLGIQDIPLPAVGELYSQAMLKVLVRMFAGTGMVFLEPKLLRPLSIPFFTKEITDFKRIQNVLKETTKHLEEAGGHPTINLGEGTNLFFKDRQRKRVKIRFDGKGFQAGNEHFSLDDLLSKVKSEPASFSTNVAARPVLQNTLLPVIAYVAGPAEMAYHRQLGDYHQFHEITMPCLIPRLSATFIPSYEAAILDACELNPWEEIPHYWPDVFPLLQEGEEAMTAEWLESAKRFFGKDLSLTAIERYVKLGGKKLVYRACRARLHQKKLPGNGLHLLRNLIHPHHNPQERLLNWWGFQAKSQENLIQKCLEQLSWDSTAHYYIYL